MATVSVSAESKGLICTKTVQNLGVLGTVHSKGLSREDGLRARKSAKSLILKLFVFVTKLRREGKSSGVALQPGLKTKTPPTDRRRNFAQKNHTTFLKIVKGKIIEPGHRVG